MKRENINYFAVGSFVLTMLFVLIVVLFRLTGRGLETIPYYAVFNNVSAVQPGNLVTYGGYEIGKVETIEPDRQSGRTRFRIKLKVRSDWQIPADSVASIVATGLLASVQIDISEGASKQMLEREGVIQGVDPTNTMAMVNSVGSEIQKLVQRFSAQTAAIGSDLESKIPEITTNVNIMVSSLQKSAMRLEQLTAAVDGKRVNNVVGNADEITQNLLRMSKGLSSAMRRMDSLIGKGNTILGDNQKDIRQTVRDLRESVAIISQDISNIVYYLESASRNMSEFSRQIRENPGVLLGGKNQNDATRE